MQQYVSIDWSESTEIEGVNYPKDNLGRQKYAQYLSNFLASKGYDATKSGDYRKHNYVLNLNSEWGSGKTYFLKRWAKDIKKHHPVVYVDAWQQDYSDDPLMAVIASMINQLREQSGKLANDAKFKAPRKLLGLLKAAAPAVAGGLTKRYLGIDPVKIMESSEEGHIGETIKDDKGNEIDMGAAASKMVSHLIDEHTAKSEAIESLKHSIEQWVEAAKANSTNMNYPAFVFIDELDRCRPSYAVEMLETIKHIFDIPGVVFVVATDTIQLQHAVKTMYGEGFDADIYLGRFFDARYSLKQMRYDQLLATHCDMASLSFSNLSERGLFAWPTCNFTSNEESNLSLIYHAFNLSAREAIQVTERLTSAVYSIPEKGSVNLYFLVILMCFSIKEPTFYVNMQNKSQNTSGISSSLRAQIDSKLSWGGVNLTLHIKPREYFEYLVGTNDEHVENQFVNGLYEVEISEFFYSVQKSLFSNEASLMAYNSSMDVLTGVYVLRDLSPGSNATNQRWKVETQNNINDWVRVISHHLKMGNQIDLGFYKDLVELSISLET